MRTLKMMKRPFFLTLLIAIALLVSACVTQAPVATSPATTPGEAPWPSQKVTIIVPFNAGGSADRSARGLASFMHEELGVPVVVQNQPGSNALLGHTAFINDPASDEGYTLLMTTQPYISNNIINHGADFAINDFSAINSHWQDWLFVAVPAASPYNTLADLIEDIKQRPGKVVWGVSAGGAGHLMGAALFETLGILDNVNIVTYDGGNPLRTALLGNQIDLSISTAEGSAGITDQLKVLAVVLDKPSDVFPGVPTINEALKPYNVQVPLVRGSVRVLMAKTTFKEKYPDRWQRLVDAYKATLERDDFQRWTRENEIPGEWHGAEASTEMVRVFHQVMVEMGHLIE